MIGPHDLEVLRNTVKGLIIPARVTWRNATNGEVIPMLRGCASPVVTMDQINRHLHLAATVPELLDLIAWQQKVISKQRAYTASLQDLIKALESPDE